MRKAVWDSMLDADLNVRYWGYLSRKYYNLDRGTKIFLAITSSGTVASWQLWIEVGWLWKLFSGASALIAIALPILNWQKSIESISYIRGKWNNLKNEYEQLWRKILNKVDNLEIEKQYKQLKTIEEEIAKHEVNFPKKDKLLNKCCEEVINSRGLNQ